MPWSFCWKSHSRKSTVLLQIHHKATSQSCPIIIKLFRGLLITLADSCSCLICDSIWHFSRICFSFPQGSQPFAESAVMVSTCFKHQLHALSLTWHLSSCNTQEQPRHMSSVAACSLAGASASATSSDAGAWQCQCTIDCLVELVETNTRHCTRIHLHKSPGAYSNILTCSPKKGLRTHRIEQETMFRQESSKSSFLPNVCGSNGPTKVRYLLLKEWEKENIRIHKHAWSAASSASSVASASASLAWGFYSWSGATCRLQKKKCPNHLSPQLLPAFANPCFQPIQAQPVMTCDATPSS